MPSIDFETLSLKTVTSAQVIGEAFSSHGCVDHFGSPGRHLHLGDRHTGSVDEFSLLS